MNANPKVVPLRANARSWEYFDQRLTELRKRDVATIIERGCVLIEMKTELEHGQYEATVKRHMSVKTATRYRIIAEDMVISNGAHGHCLPPSWRTLYELTKLPDDLKLARIKDGTINPKMERNDAMAIRDRINPTKIAKIEQAIKANPTANQRDAAKALGTSTGTYRRTYRRLIHDGEIDRPKKPEAPKPELPMPEAPKPGAAKVAKGKAESKQDTSLDEKRRNYASPLKSLSPDEQAAEIKKLMYGDLEWTTEIMSKLFRMTILSVKR